MVKHFDEAAHVAFERVRKPDEHRQPRQHHSPLDIADERHIRSATLRELRLSQVSREAKLP